MPQTHLARLRQQQKLKQARSPSPVQPERKRESKLRNKATLSAKNNKTKPQQSHEPEH